MLQEIVQSSRAVSLQGEPRMISHLCPVERLRLGIEEGQECNWCGHRARRAQLVLVRSEEVESAYSANLT